MTPEQMDRLDQALAEKFGWTIRDHEFLGSSWYDGDKFLFKVSDWFPTRRIDQALGDGGPGTVVGEMREKGRMLVLITGLYDKAAVRFITGKETWNILNQKDYEYANTPSLAICLAAAEALEIKVEKSKGGD